MERDESATPIAGREFAAVVDRRIIGRPVSRKSGDRALPIRTDARSPAAIPAIPRSENQSSLRLIVVAFWPTVVGPGRKLQQTLGGQRGALLGCIESRPVLKKLLAPMLRYEQATGCVECEALAIANSARITLRR